MLATLILLFTVAMSTDHQLWQTLRENYLGLRSLSGSFEQLVQTDTEADRRFVGSFWTILPDRYRLEVSEPEQQLMVAGDSLLWFYFPTESRAVREAQPRAMPLLAFLEPVLDSSSEVRFEADQDGQRVVVVEPADEMATIQNLRLELSPDGRRIDAFDFSDPWGNQYRFLLKFQVWNPDLPAELFEFTPPPGTNIE